MCTQTYIYVLYMVYTYLFVFFVPCLSTQDGLSMILQHSKTSQSPCPFLIQSVGNLIFLDYTLWGFPLTRYSSQSP